jgi:uncharacterized repeat protein (TIGR01451 family)
LHDHQHRHDSVLTLAKTLVQDNGGAAFDSIADWTLSASGPTPLSGHNGETAVTNASVNAGTYSLSESGPSGYTASAWVCSGGSQNGSSLTLMLGQTATCTITNDDQPAKLTVNKVVDNSNGGSLQANDVPLFVNGNAVTNGQQVTLNAGTYTVSETQQTGYTGTIDGNCASNGTITLHPGDVKTCTITNTSIKPGLTVIKTVVTNNGGTATVGTFTLHVTDSEESTTDVTSGVSNDLVAGTYTVSESGGPAGGYHATFGGDCNSQGSVTLGVGETKVCTIVNDDVAPSLTLVKEVNKTHGGTAVASDWTLTATGNQDNPTVISDDGGVSSGPNFQAGTYTLSESDGPAGYSAGNWSCTGVENNGSHLSLDVGQSATCTIINSDTAPSLHVIKHVITDNGGSAHAADFTMNVTGTNVSSASFPGAETGTVVTLDSGTYSVTESGGPDGYGASMSADCSGTIAVGDDKTCTITNDDGKATLTIVKHTIGLDGSFNFTVTHSDGESTVQDANPTLETSEGVATSSDIALDAGTYRVSEIVPQNWFLLPGTGLEGARCVYDNESIGISVTNGENITVDAGDHVTCTFVNQSTLSDLSVSKSVDNASPDHGGTITYTITATNHGPHDTTAVAVSDVLPGGVTYVSDDSATTETTYDATSGFWTVGTLHNGESKVLHIVGTVAASAGVTVTNTASISADSSNADIHQDNNSGSASFTVHNPGGNGPPGGGGGGGGGGGNGPPISLGGGGGGPVGQVLGASTALPDLPPGCTALLTTYMRLGKKGNLSSEVTKLQTFLNSDQQAGLPVTGFFGTLTDKAVRNFQGAHAEQVLTPWGLSKPTGFVYLTTQRWINLIYCKSLDIPMPNLVPYSGQ